MAEQQTNLCVYRKGHCLWRNTGPYCTALSLYVMSSVKFAAGEDWGIFSLYLALLDSWLYKSKDFYGKMKHPPTLHPPEFRGHALQPSQIMFVCGLCKMSSFCCDLPVFPLSGIVAVCGKGLGFEELTESIAGLPFAWGWERHSL